MNAKEQYTLGAQDLQTLLALLRSGTLAVAAERLHVDTSTVFRALQRMESGLGQRLFERSRAGYRPTELAAALAERAERIESELESARSEAQRQRAEIAGTLRLTTTDTILHGLVAPQLAALRRAHPLLQFEISTGNQLSNLTRRDADIALRATQRPPPHLVGRQVGPIRMALYAAESATGAYSEMNLEEAPWVAPDDALPSHPSVLWRRHRHPRNLPAYRVDSILSVAELIAADLGIGVLPIFLGDGRRDLKQISPPLEECETQLWLLTHPECRHLSRVSVVFSHLAEHLKLHG
ncbi:LysR family transcriptional regulator [Microbulbifer halophilus]|uniref:LysR family transcriptional regulator n=1 Tax=Microbulbifer halophilus TaxID=453963 RepID=A0ABW5EBI9_9GAMM|nr:LysR family transcriptional regulator [Microbulbifer halophilus]MCW8125519.1 LysR family transcriptional regulator [Microbulbifer halophilus]